MNAPTFEIPTEMRAFAEKSVDQARTAVSNLMGTAVKTAGQVQTSSKSMQESLHAVVAKGFDQVQDNAGATFDFAQKLVRSRDMREALELQAEFLRTQIATMQAQAKDLGAMIQKAAPTAA